jgi:alkaline phosphatase
LTPGAHAYFSYFGLNAGLPGLGYYSYELGTAWHAISLNSEVAMGPGSPQHAWLAADLAVNRSRCTVAYLHRPIYSSGQNRDNPQVLPLWRLLYEANADIVLAGHDHLYERFTPIDPEGRPDPIRGIRQFIVGTGGVTPLYQFVNIKSTSDFRNNSNHGVLKLTLETDSYSWDFIATGAGRVLDSGRGTCH